MEAPGSTELGALLCKENEMVEARGYIGLGTVLAYTDDLEPEPPAEVVWNEIARVTELGDIGFGDLDQVDVSGFDTPTRTREFIPGMGDPPELEVTGAFVADESQLALEELHASGAVVHWQATLPDDLAFITFDAYVADFALNIEREDKLEFTASLQLSGRPELTIPEPPE